MAIGITLTVICVASFVAFVVLRRREPDEDDPVAGSPPAARSSKPADAGDELREIREMSDRAEPDLQASAEALFDTPEPVDTPEPGPQPNAKEPSVAKNTASQQFATNEPSVAQEPSDAPKPSVASKPSVSDSESTKKHWLVGVTKRIKDKTFHIGDKRATIGRLPNNFVQLDDGDISRVHCQLRSSGDSLQVMPMETQNGTRVNGELVEPHSLRTLEDGDFLEVGNSVLAYHLHADFESNDAEGKKSRGITVEMATAMVGGAKWADRIESELTAHGGDVEKTARTLGIEPEVLSHMIDQLGVNND